MSCNETTMRVIQGETKTQQLVLRRSNGELVDLLTELAAGDDAIKLQVRENEMSDTALITLNLAGGITVRNPQTGTDLGIADIELPPSATIKVADGGTWPDAVENVGLFRWDIRVQLAGGQTFYVVPPSNFVLLASVTK